MSELTIVLKVEVDQNGLNDDVHVGTATAHVVRVGTDGVSSEVEPTVILVRIER